MFSNANEILWYQQLSQARMSPCAGWLLPGQLQIPLWMLFSTQQQLVTFDVKNLIVTCLNKLLYCYRKKLP